MYRLAICLIGAAALVGIVLPIWLIFEVIDTSQKPWIETLKDYKELAGSLATLVAASFAALEIITNVQSQRDNAAGERTHQGRRLASALQGEVTMIWNLFDDFEKVVGFVIDSVQGDKVIATGIRVKGDLDQVFHNDPGCIGWLPVPLPELVARFYGLYATISYDLNFVADFIESEKTTEGKHKKILLLSSYKVVLDNLRIMRETVGVAIPALGAVAEGRALTENLEKLERGLGSITDAERSQYDCPAYRETPWFHPAVRRPQRDCLGDHGTPWSRPAARRTRCDCLAYHETP